MRDEHPPVAFPAAIGRNRYATPDIIKLMATRSPIAHVAELGKLAIRGTPTAKATIAETRIYPHPAYGRIRNETPPSSTPSRMKMKARNNVSVVMPVKDRNASQPPATR